MFGKKPPPAAAATREKRRAKRLPANAPAIVQTTASRLQVTIVNISVSGARLVTEEEPPDRQDVQVIINGVCLFGRITWRRDKTFAVKFEEGLQGHPPAEILRAVEEANVPRYEFDREEVLAALANRPPNDISLRTGPRPLFP